MEKKEVIAINPVSVAGVKLVPVSKLKINCRQGKRGCAIYGNKQPDSIIVATQSEKRVFRVTGEEITLEQLSEEFPEIIKTIEEL